MKILIIGGNGELGCNIFTVMKENILNTLFKSSRNPSSKDILFNWDDSNTWQNVLNNSVIINASPITNFNNYALFLKLIDKHACTFIETSADIKVVKFMMEFSSKNIFEQGLIVHGAGIFPGISNFMTKKALEIYPNTTDLRFNVRYTIFSKAGRDMCKLMADSLAIPAFSYNYNKMIEETPIGHFQKFEFENKSWRGFSAALPDTLYMHAQKPTLTFVSSYFSPLPDFILPVLKVFNVFPKSAFFLKIYETSFYLLRAKIFKHKTSDMLLSLLIDKKHIINHHTHDAIKEAGYGVAAILPFIAKQKGIKVVTELCGVEEFFKSLKEIKA